MSPASYQTAPPRNPRLADLELRRPVTGRIRDRALRTRHRLPDRPLPDDPERTEADSSATETLAVVAEAGEKFPRLSLRPEHMDGGRLPLLGNNLECSFMLRTTITHDHADQPPFIVQTSPERIRTAAGHLADGLHKPSSERPGRACPPVRVEKHNGVR